MDMNNLGDYGVGGRIVVVLIVLAFIVIVQLLRKRRRYSDEKSVNDYGGAPYAPYAGWELRPSDTTNAESSSDCGNPGHGAGDCP